jgi:MarR family transcriptional regulator, organic hydroperoxide resistance regulator
MPFEFKSSVPMLDAWMLLNQTNNNISSYNDELYFKMDISVAQHNMLLAIKYMGPLPTESQIAEWLGKKLNTVSTFADRMEKAGLIVRVKNSKDRRSYRFRVTKKGETFLKKNIVHRSKQIKEIMGCLSEEETQTLIKLLRKVRLQTLRQLHQDESLKELKIGDKDPIVQSLSSVQRQGK